MDRSGVDCTQGCSPEWDSGVVGGWAALLRYAGGHPGGMLSLTAVVTIILRELVLEHSLSSEASDIAEEASADRSGNWPGSLLSTVTAE